ncbi:MAG: hypothetical protein JXK05_02945 [Campylobacterales bacterium]|nr:hypothetical protein [Campylobacterales bacterium]
MCLILTALFAALAWSFFERGLLIGALVFAAISAVFAFLMLYKINKTRLERKKDE